MFGFLWCLLISGGFFYADVMLCPEGLPWVADLAMGWGLVTLVIFPTLGWLSFILLAWTAFQAESHRFLRFIGYWLAASLVADVGVIFLALCLRSSEHHEPSWEGHQLIVYDPRGGFIIGELCFCLLVSVGFWSMFAPFMTRRTLESIACVTAAILFFGLRGVAYALNHL